MMIKVKLLVPRLDLPPLIHTEYPVGVISILANTMQLYGVPPGGVQELQTEPHNGLSPLVVQSHWLQQFCQLVLVSFTGSFWCWPVCKELPQDWQRNFIAGFVEKYCSNQKFPGLCEQLFLDKIKWRFGGNPERFRMKFDSSHWVFGEPFRKIFAPHNSGLPSNWFCLNTRASSHDIKLHKVMQSESNLLDLKYLSELYSSCCSSSTKKVAAY